MTLLVAVLLLLLLILTTPPLTVPPLLYLLFLPLLLASRSPLPAYSKAKVSAHPSADEVPYEKHWCIPKTKLTKTRPMGTYITYYALVQTPTHAQADTSVKPKEPPQLTFRSTPPPPPILLESIHRSCYNTHAKTVTTFAKRISQSYLNTTGS